MSNRECGSCYACCVHLGVAELRKYPGQTCKNLDGTDPKKRCSIYADRPKACQQYYCGWLAGIGPDGGRPSDSGLLVTTYAPGQEQDGTFITSIHIIAPKGAPQGILAALKDTTSLLFQTLNHLATLGSRNIRVVQGKKVVLLTAEMVYLGEILPNKSFEDLDFVADNRPIGRWLVTAPVVPNGKEISK